jgi:hypothetical protein
MKFGRKPRRFDPRVPHLSALLAGRRKALAPAPAACTYIKALPDSLGMMGNDRLGDCTCAGLLHALQVWTANANPPIDTEPDTQAVQLYQEACGYKPGQPNTDQGGVEQDVLTYAMLAGIPVVNGNGRHRITAFVEIDPANFADVKLAIFTAGLAYIGFNVPSYLPEEPGATWDVQPGIPQIAGGHCVIVAGYDDAGLDVISWGAKYRMTWAFWSEFVDEAYMIADADWVTSSGKSPAGLSLTELETQMQALRSGGASSADGRIVVPPFAPTGLATPVPADPRLGQLTADRDALHTRATQAEGRAARAESLLEDASSERDRYRKKADEAANRVSELIAALGQAQAERDHARSQLADHLARSQASAKPA